MSNALKAILFDLDGTLAHTAPDLADAVNKLRTEHGLAPVPEAVVSTMIGNGSRTLVKRALQYESFFVQEESALDSAHDKFMGYYGINFCQRSVLYHGVAETLTTLHRAGLHLAVVTNKPERFIEPLLRQFGIASHFSTWIGGDSLAEKKPSALPLMTACEQMGCTATEALMVGDSVTDVSAARAANMTVACVDYGYNHGEDIHLAKPDVVIGQFSELLGIPSIASVVATSS